jgi:uncharacterized membrane protein YoaK (UPF0700 family)
VTPPPAISRLRDGLLVALTFSAGAVDAISFLGLGKVFTANMTGNIVLLGVGIGRGASPEVVRSAISLGAFTGGVFLASWLAGRWQRPAVWPAGVTVALAVEALAQAGLWTGWLLAHGRPAPVLEAALVGTSALAMGLQSGAARVLNVAGVTTAYVTGTLTGLIGGLTASGGSATERLLRGLVLVALLGGAAVSTVLVLDARHWAPLLPLVLTAGVVASALVFLRRDPG